MVRFSDDSPGVQSHIALMQDVIGRMAANSASSKSWCITLVSAILVIVAEKHVPQFAFLAVLPTLCFGILDTYYLALEKRFRASYNLFIGKLHGTGIEAEDLFAVTPQGSQVEAVRDAIGSPSVFLFYGVLLVMVWATAWVMRV